MPGLLLGDEGRREALVLISPLVVREGDQDVREEWGLEVSTVCPGITLSPWIRAARVGRRRLRLGLGRGDRLHEGGVEIRPGSAASARRCRSTWWRRRRSGLWRTPPIGTMPRAGLVHEEAASSWCIAGAAVHLRDGEPEPAEVGHLPVEVEVVVDRVVLGELLALRRLPTLRSQKPRIEATKPRGRGQLEVQGAGQPIETGRPANSVAQPVRCGVRAPRGTW